MQNHAPAPVPVRAPVSIFFARVPVVQRPIAHRPITSLITHSLHLGISPQPIWEPYSSTCSVTRCPAAGRGGRLPHCEMYNRRPTEAA
eukprot:scaffold2830_cov123-Isochrysis_galbana.AAC.7